MFSAHALADLYPSQLSLEAEKEKRISNK